MGKKRMGRKRMGRKRTAVRHEKATVLNTLSRFFKKPAMVFQKKGNVFLKNTEMIFPKEEGIFGEEKGGKPSPTHSGPLSGKGRGV